MKKLVTNDEHEKLKEEMAWQVAEMIVRDVTRSVLMTVLQDDTRNGMFLDFQCNNAREGED